MSDPRAVQACLHEKIGYTATDAELQEVCALLEAIDAVPGVSSVLGSEPATVYRPLPAEDRPDPRND